MALVRAVRLINNITGGNYTGATLNSALGNAVTLSDYEQAINVRSQARNLASSISGVTVVGSSAIAANEMVSSAVGFYEIFYNAPALTAFTTQSAGFSAVNSNVTAKALVKSSFTRDNALIAGLTGTNLISWIDGGWILAPGNASAGDPMSPINTEVYTFTSGIFPSEVAFWAGDTYYKTGSDGTYNDQRIFFTSNLGQTWTNSGNVNGLIGTSNRVLFSVTNGFVFASGNGVGTGNLYYYTSSGWGTTNLSYSSTVPQGVAYGNGVYVSIDNGTNAAYSTSPTGPWTIVATGLPIAGYRIYFENGLFFLIGTSSQVATSTNGVTWTSRSTVSTASTPTGFFYKNNRYFITGLAGLMTSTDGITWTYVASVAGQIYAIEYFNGTYYAACLNGYATSTNGTTWTKPTSITGLGITNNLTFWDAKIVGSVLYLQASTRTILSLDGTNFSASAFSQGGPVIATKKTGATPATAVFQAASRLSYGLK